MKSQYDGGFISGLGRITDIVLLQIYFLVTSLPVVTIGAGLAALYATCGKLHRDSVTSTTKTCFREFRANLKKGTAVWVPLLLAFLHLPTGLLATVLFALSGAVFVIATPLFFLIGVSGPIYMIGPLFQRAIAKSAVPPEGGDDGGDGRELS